MNVSDSENGPSFGRQAGFDDLNQSDGEGQSRIEGVVQRIVFESEETGFVVGRLRIPGETFDTTFVGNLLAVSEGETVRLWGQWVNDPRFGKQLRVEKYQTVLPQTAEAIERYLGSGLIEGIGPAFAKRLVKAFGIETLRVIDEEPEKLRSVEGIGPKRAAQIRAAWDKQRALQSIMLFLQGHGIGMSHAVKIYTCYGDKAVTVLRENPYRLAYDIPGIAFKTADAIAKRLDMPPDAPERLEAGLRYVLDEAQSEGHAFLLRDILLTLAADLLQVDPDKLATVMPYLVERRTVVEEDDAVYLPPLLAAERGVARGLKRLLDAPRDEVRIDADKAVAWVEKFHGITLSPEQRQAIGTAVNTKVMVITGGPGTGKTTILNGLLAIFSAKKLFSMLAAPTGRAAKRMAAATGRESKTIHRLLEFSPRLGGFARNEGNPIPADVFVIDETSMVDIFLMHSLLKALPSTARLILVGDVDQLPSVGPGNVLMDIIASGAAPVVRLETVFRQAAESGIVSNAHRINHGEFPEFNSDDFVFIERKDPAQALATVLELVTRRIPRKFGLDPKRDIQVLAPMHRGEAGVTRLNEALQEALNPDGETVPRRGFRIGDKVMQMRNNYDLDVFNGDVGVVRLMNEELREVQVLFEEHEVLYTFDDLDELNLAYACTVHKSQGSEYPAVVVPLLTQHYMMLQRNVLYTAVTRAGKLVVVVGDRRAVGLAIRNTKVTHRNSRLVERLRGEKPVTGAP